MSKDIASLAITVDASSVASATSQLEGLAAAGRRAAGAANEVGGAVKAVPESGARAGIAGLLAYYEQATKTFEQAAKTGKQIGSAVTAVSKAIGSAEITSSATASTAATRGLVSASGQAISSATRMTGALSGWAAAGRVATAVTKGLVAELGGPLGVAYVVASTGASLLHAAQYRQTAASREASREGDLLSKAMDAYGKAADRAATASEGNRLALKREADQARKTALATLETARANLAAAQQKVNANLELTRHAGEGAPGLFLGLTAGDGSLGELSTAQAAFDKGMAELAAIEARIKDGERARSEAANDYLHSLDVRQRMLGKTAGQQLVMEAEEQVAGLADGAQAKAILDKARALGAQIDALNASTVATKANRQESEGARKEDVRRREGIIQQSDNFVAALRSERTAVQLSASEQRLYNAAVQAGAVFDYDPRRADAIMTEAEAYETSRAAAEASAAANDRAWAEYEAIETQRLEGLDTASKAAAQLEFEASLIGKNARERAVLNAELFLTNNHVARGTAEWDRYMKAATAAGDRELKADDLTKFNASLDAMVKKTQDAATLMEKAFGSVGKAIGGMAVAYTGYAKARETADREIKENPTKRAEAELKLNQAQVKSYGDMAAAAKGFFKEKSAGYKAMEKAERAFRAIELAMALKAMLTDTAQTTTHVANESVRSTASGVTAYAKTMASLPFPFNIAAGAVVLGLLAAVGIKIAGGKGGAVKVPTAEERQKSQGSGTVLGDASAKSDSIDKSLSLIEQHTNKELEYSNPMLSALRSIDSSIGKVSDQLARQIGRPGGLFDTSGLNLGKSGSMLFGGVPLLGGLFGSKTTRTLNDVGLEFGSQTLADLKNGAVSGQSYQEVIEQTKKKFFGLTYSNKSKVSTTNSPLDEALQTSIKDVFEGVYDAVKAGAAVIGVGGAGAMLDSFALELGKVSLKDLKGSEITDALNAVFSAAADKIAEAAVPFIDELREIGEGAFETLTRVAREYQVIDTTLASIGKTFGLVGVDSLKARDQLVDAVGGLDALVSGANAFADAFLTEAEKMAPVQKAVAAEMAKLGYAAVDTKDEFKELVLGLDVSTEEGAKLYAALMAVAPAFAKVADYAVQTQGVLSSLTAEQQRWVDETVQATVAAAQQADMRAPSHRDRVESARAQRDRDKKAAEEAAKAWTELKASLDATAASALKAGDVMGALKARTDAWFRDPANANYIRDQSFFSNTPVDPVTGKRSFNVAGYNRMRVRTEADEAARLLPEVYANAIKIPNVMQALEGLWQKMELPRSAEFGGRGWRDGAIDGGPLYSGEYSAGAIYGQSVLLPGGRGWGYGADVGDYLGRKETLTKQLADAEGAVAGLSDATAEFTRRVAAGEIAAADLSAEIAKLDRQTNANRQAVIDATQALADLNAEYGEGFGDFALDAAAQKRRLDGIIDAGVTQRERYILSVFGQFTAGVGELTNAAREADAPIARLTDAIGRMHSISDLLSGQYRASFKEGPIANLIANAAGVAANVLTTEDAKRASAALAANDNFAGLSTSALRDVALMFDGLSAFDATSFENTFMRLNDAFSHGRLTQEQYTAAFNYSLDVFEGLAGAAGGAADGLRDLAGQLKLDENLSPLSLMERLGIAKSQFEGNRTEANARTYLELAQQSATNEADYRRVFGAVIGGQGGSPRLQVDTSALEAKMDAQIATQNAKSDSIIARLDYIGTNTADTSDTLDRVTRETGGTAFTTQAAA